MDVRAHEMGGSAFAGKIAALVRLFCRPHPRAGKRVMLFTWGLRPRLMLAPAAQAKPAFVQSSALQGGALSDGL